MQKLAYSANKSVICTHLLQPQLKEKPPSSSQLTLADPELQSGLQEVMQALLLQDTHDVRAVHGGDAQESSQFDCFPLLIRAVEQ